MKILAIDVGGTFTKYAIIDEKLNITNKDKTKTIANSLDNYLKMLVSIYGQFKGQVEGIAFSMPGVIDTKAGYFYTGGSFDNIVHEINLKKELEKYIDVPMSFGNDAKCAANAELGFGVLKDVNQAIVYVIGTAIGGALINNHKVIEENFDEIKKTGFLLHRPKIVACKYHNDANLIVTYYQFLTNNK